ncbi:MAG: AAA family ATPase [Bacteroidota bacterium]
MEEILEKSFRTIQQVPLKIERKVPGNLDWNWRLNAIVGARGTGKTTLLKQRAKILKDAGEEVLYISLDDLYFTENNLIDLVRTFEQSGGKFLFIDEVHKYPGWARELKNLYDSYPQLIVVFSGSSILEIFRQEVDLSRRALVYELPGLSFREYLAFGEYATLPTFKLEDILSSHRDLAASILSQIKPLQYFPLYLERGYYPFFVEPYRDYQLTLTQVAHLVVESDLQHMEGYDPSYSRKLLQLLRIISGSSPFKPNISKLGERIGISRKTLLNYLGYLEKARLISLMHLPETSISVLQKPEKVFLNNSNLYYALNPQNISIGSIRETFFQNQLSVIAEVHLHRKTDFQVTYKEKSHVFEIGGRGKDSSQIKDISQAFLALDGLEIGNGNRIPLWLFGFLY